MSAAPASYRPIRAVIADAARRWPDRVYMHCIDQNKSLTYGALERLADRIAGFLAARGIGAGDRVLLLSENSVEFVAVFLGVLRHGATIATANVEMNRAHLAEIVGAVRPRLVLVQEGLGLEKLVAGAAPGEVMALGEWRESGAGTGFFAALADHPAAGDRDELCGADDIAVIFYTSGTEAKPKGVLLTHSGVWHNFDATADCVRLGAGDRMLDCRSYTWLSAQNMSLGGPLTRGASVYMAKHFSRRRYFDWLTAYRIHIGIAVPTILNMLLSEPVAIRGTDLPDLRFLMTSSAPLLPEQWKRFEETYGIRVCQSYGCSEGGLMAGHRGTDRKIGTVGLPLKYQQMRIVGPDGSDLPPGETGEIVVAGPQKSHAYLHPDGTVETLPEAGHRTGDLGYFDADGHLHVTGRLKEVIIRGGVNISPVEVDGVLAAHPDVAEAAAVGVPHPIYGEEVVCYVVARPGAALAPDSVLAHCAARLAPFKTPKEAILCESLPRNARGKLDRRALAEMWKRAERR